MPASGWMPDPSETSLERYWDGARWTGRTRNRYTRLETGVVAPSYSSGSYDPRGYQLADSYAEVSTKTRRPASQRVSIVVAIVLVLVTAYFYANSLGFTPSVQAVTSQVTEAVEPDSAQVDYPVFGSTKLVNHLERGMIAQERSIDVTYWARVNGSDAVTDAMNEAYTQNPYLFSGGWTVVSDTASVAVEPDYVYDKHEAERRRVATKAAVDRGVVSSGALDATSDTDKVTAIHGHIIGAGTYDYTAFDEINAKVDSARVQQSQEAYGLLVEGTSVCNGYAQAFNAMAQAVGLRSVEVTGSDSAGVTGGSHAWNKVLVDGEWLLVDTTWDDVEAGPRSDYLMLRADAPILATRTQDTNWVVDANLGAFGR